MPLFKQTAYISPSPVTATIGGTFQLPIPPTIIVPAYNIQDGNQVIATGRGVWVNNLEYYSTNASGATTYLLPDIEGCYGSFLAGLPSTITTFSVPNIIYIGGSALGAGPATLASLTSISFPKLYYIGSSLLGNMTINAVTSLDISSLVYLSSFTPTSMNGLTSLSLPNVKIIGQFSFASTSCTSINLSSLISVSTISALTIPSCTTLTLPSLGTWKICQQSITITSCAFNQTTVDNLLSAIAYMDGSNSTFLYGSGKTLTITGTSSAPSNLGSTTTAGSNFVGAGTTCTVNLTSHGYATDDVLRISGITTLTNANRYARITVVNANQFTYTITSQTATGAGTATIVKAGASAKALVTRGVTLTTN